MYKVCISFVVLSAISLISSCATPTWYRANTSPYQMENDLSKCRYDIRMNKMSEARVEQITQDCMRARGYRWR